MSDAVANPSGTVSFDGPISVEVENKYTLVSVFNEITGVASGLETTITSYQSNVDDAYLQLIKSSGQNLGEIKIYKNENIIDKNYLYYTVFNVDFDYRTTIPALPGLPLTFGDTIKVKALNNSDTLCNFNAKIQVLEAINA